MFTNLYEVEKNNFLTYEETAKVARSEGDESSLNFITQFIDIQINEIAEFEVLMGKVKAYSAIPGLFYHLDHELRK